MSYNAKCNYNDTFGMVKYWETIIYNFLKEQNIQTPPQRLKTGNDKMTPIIGAYVKEPLVGGHNWVMSFDLNSLYPHIIMQYNISPEKMVTGIRQDVNVERMLNKECDLSYVKQRTTVYLMVSCSNETNKVSFLNSWRSFTMKKAWKKKMIEYQKEREIVKMTKRKKRT